MTDVMEHSRHTDSVTVIHIETDGIGHPPGQVICSQRMFETCVVCAREHEVSQAELLHGPESLHLVAVHDLHEDAVDGYASVDGIMDHLGSVHAITRRSSRACPPHNG